MTEHDEFRIGRDFSRDELPPETIENLESSFERKYARKADLEYITWVGDERFVAYYGDGNATLLFSFGRDDRAGS